MTGSERNVRAAMTGSERNVRAAIGAAGYDVLNEVVLNQVVVAFGDPARTDATIAAVQNEGTCWCGPTTWRGRRAMRISASCWNTAEADIDRSIAAVLRCVTGRQ